MKCLADQSISYAMHKVDSKKNIAKSQIKTLGFCKFAGIFLSGLIRGEGGVKRYKNRFEMSKYYLRNELN